MRIFQTLQPRNSTPTSGMSVGDDERDDRPDRRPDAVPGEEALHAPMLADRLHGRPPVGYASPGCSARLGADGDGPLLGAAHDADLERPLDAPRARRRGRRASRIVPPAGRTMRSPASMPAAAAGLPSSTPRTRTPSRSGRPTERRSRRATWLRRDGHAQPRRVAATRRGRARRPGCERGVGRDREVEALADPVRVEADELARAVDQRAAGRTRARAAPCARRCPSIRRPPGPRNARATAETSPNVTRGAAADRGRDAEHRRRRRRARRRRPSRSAWRRSCRP